MTVPHQKLAVAVEDLVRREIETSEKKLTLLNEPELYLALDVRVYVYTCIWMCTVWIDVYVCVYTFDIYVCIYIYICACTGVEGRQAGVPRFNFFCLSFVSSLHACMHGPTQREEGSLE